MPEVYYDYCQYGGNPIDISYKRKIELKITNKDEKILEKIIDKYIDLPIVNLVKMTQKEGMPWDSIYNKGTGNRYPIPFELIKELECQYKKDMILSS